MNPAVRRLWVGLGILALLAGVAWWTRRGSSLPSVRGPLSPQAAEAAARAYLEIEAREQAAATQVWGPELEAESFEDEILRWWDQLNGAPDPWVVLSNIALEQTELPRWIWNDALPDGSQTGTLLPRADASGSLDREAWRAQLRSWSNDRWKLVRTHWALVGHRAASGNVPAQSILQAGACLENQRTLERLSLDVRATLVWKASQGGLPELRRVEGISGQAVRRTGPPPFRLELDAAIPTDRSIFTDPLLCWDLNEDGVPELVLVGADRVFQRRPNEGAGAGWTSSPWLGLPMERVVAALYADVNGDGQNDLVILGSQGVRWWPGVAAKGPLPGTEVAGWNSPAVLKHPQSLTAGDIDGDGDLDLWGTQYKLPYQGGQFPTPWDDANDGFPSYLLLNDGAGHFTDGTERAGLAPKRHRRTYSASFIDLDNDGDLDLVNVSDFAGLDVYLNDGRGHFTDVTARLGGNRHAFGMSHAVTDLNGDGRADLLMLGMTSAVADRLGYGALERGATSLDRVRDMTFGNRLFFGSPGAVPLVPAPPGWSSAVARTGWTWGAAWADFDLDSRMDLAVANGHETRASVRDYERQFWLHDRFVGGSANDPAVDLYFRTAAGRRQADQASYGGWQSNALLFNAGPAPWPDLAWVLGVAVPEDSRNLVATDVDGDGRPDLVVTTLEEWPVRRQRLLVFHNELPTADWVGFRWKGPYPTGGRLKLETSESSRFQWFLTGDGYRSQGTASIAFGTRVPSTGTVLLFRPGQAAMRKSVDRARSWLELGPGGR